MSSEHHAAHISLISRRDLGFGTIVWVRHMEHAAARSSLAPPSNTLQRDSDVDRQSDSPLHRLTTERSLPGFAPAEMVAPGQQPQQGVCGFLGQGGSLPMQGQFMGSSGQYDASYQTQHAYSPPGMISPQHTDLPPPRGGQISPNGQHWGGVPTGGTHACEACGYGYDASGYRTSPSAYHPLDPSGWGFPPSSCATQTQGGGAREPVAGAAGSPRSPPPPFDLREIEAMHELTEQMRQHGGDDPQGLLLLQGMLANVIMREQRAQVRSAQASMAGSSQPR